MQEGHKMVSGFLETRKDAAIMLDLVEKAFDKMAFLVKMPVVDPEGQAVGTGRDDGLGALGITQMFSRTSAKMI